jgi:hypothetical protein
MTTPASKSRGKTVVDDTGMGPEVMTSSSRSSKRRRNGLVLGGLAIALVGGLFVTGALPTGDRSGTATSSCATGGGKQNTCVLGDIGPGGGIVFYAKENSPRGLKYAEAASSDWAGSTPDPLHSWAAAGVAAQGFTGGGVAWRLPTIFELSDLYQQRDVVGGSFARVYWSSTRSGSELYFGQDFKSGDSPVLPIDKTLSVRPVRNF